MSIIKSALINISFDASLVQKEVAALPFAAWQPHMNRYHYEGEWNVLSLRSPGGGHNALADPLNNEAYADTAWMQQCPYILQLLNRLQCEKLSARLLSLLPGAVIKEHTDKELFFEKGEARLHFPILTNPDVEFYLDNARLQMKEGQCWYINANLPHRLANKGYSNRVHLVVDCRVNDWLRDVFQNNCIEKDELTDTDITTRNQDTIINTIRELRRQNNNAVAQELAGKLEEQLHDAGLSYPLPTTARTQPTATAATTDTMIIFIRSIGIGVHEDRIEENTFLPGMRINNGELIIDKTKLLYPGDLLHEAGHIAVIPAEARPMLNEKSINESEHREAEEMMAIAWSYAACVHLNIDPYLVFHEDGYKGGGQSIVENFQAGRFFGTPMLQWCGMTIEPKHNETSENVFPKMINWMRE